jgi:outer membrane protein
MYFKRYTRALSRARISALLFSFILLNLLKGDMAMKVINKMMFGFMGIALSVMVMNVANADEKAMSSLKIGVIDLQQIIQETPDAKKVNAELRKQFEPRQQKLAETEKKLQADVDKLKRDDAIMAENEKTKLQENILTQRRNLEREQQDYQQDISVAQRRETDKFFAKVKKVVDEIAAKDHYDLVLQKNTIPFASNRLEITKQVIAILSDKESS